MAVVVRGRRTFWLKFTVNVRAVGDTAVLLAGTWVPETIVGDENPATRVTQRWLVVIPRLSKAVKQKTCDPYCWLVGVQVMSTYLLGDVPLMADFVIP
jgi:hypothetical protein